MTIYLCKLSKIVFLLLTIFLYSQTHFFSLKTIFIYSQNTFILFHSIFFLTCQTYFFILYKTTFDFPLKFLRGQFVINGIYTASGEKSVYLTLATKKIKKIKKFVLLS